MVSDEELSAVLVQEAGMTAEEAEIGVVCHQEVFAAARDRAPEQKAEASAA